MVRDMCRGDDDRTKSKADASITGSTICERDWRKGEPNNILIPLATYPSGVCEIIRDITPVQNGFRNREHVRVKRVCFTDRKTFFRDRLKTRVLTLVFFLCPSAPLHCVLPARTRYLLISLFYNIFYYFFYYRYKPISVHSLQRRRKQFWHFNAIYRRSQTKNTKLENRNLTTLPFS